ncbi:unnamed protein product [Penicillium glandicola]
MARGAAGRDGRGGGKARGLVKENRTCFYCHRRGHLRAACPTIMAIDGLVQMARANGTLVNGIVPPAPPTPPNACHSASRSAGPAGLKSGAAASASGPTASAAGPVPAVHKQAILAAPRVVPTRRMSI